MQHSHLSFNQLLMVVTAPAGLHDAVGRQYLASMSFGVCQDAAQTELLEEFVYNFSYDTPDSLRMTDKHGNEVQLNVSSQGSQVCMATLAT